MEDALISIMTEALLQKNVITAETPAESVPIFRQGSLGEEDAYPSTFLTFWAGTEYESTAYDNDTATVIWTYSVNAYSEDVSMVYSLIKLLRRLCKKAGWQTPDRGHDVASDEITHTGRGINVTYLETFTPNAEPEPTPPAPPEPDTEPQEITQEEQANG